MGLELPSAWPVVEDEAVAFASAVIDACAAAGRLEAELHRSSGRPRSLEVRAVLVALLLLAMEGRALHLTEVARLLYCRLSVSCKERLGVSGEAGSRKGASPATGACAICSTRCWKRWTRRSSTRTG